jgi:hypothetical protein
MLFGFLAMLAIAASGALAAESMHGEIAKYEGAKTCVACHDTAAKEVAESLHYQMKAEPSLVEGLERGKDAGLLVDFSPLYHTFARLAWLETIRPAGASLQEQPRGCGVCHPGLGAQPQALDKLSAADFANIDCLICHGPDYQRVVVKEGKKSNEKGKAVASFKIVPAAGVDILRVARHAQKPTSEMCLRCHASTGDGDLKHGIASAEMDVHLSMGMGCTDCHTVKKHKIAGGADLKAQELTDVPVGCPNCHTSEPHKGDFAPELNRHCDRIACQTCHIPAVARDANTPAVTGVDWTTPKKNAKSGLFEPATQKASLFKPEYFWWNRTMHSTGEPAGSKRDRRSRIYPWQRITCTVIADAATGTPLPLKASVYAVTGDVGAAARKGATEAKQAYCGQWKGIQQSVLLSVNHQVAPKALALKCDDCHTENGRLDFKALGYGRK